MASPHPLPPVLAAVRRSAARGVLGIAALSLLCNLGMLAGPLVNMQVFNRVLPTRDLGTLGALMTGFAIWLGVYAVLDTLRGAALEALAGRVAKRLSVPLLRAAAAGGRGSGGVGQALADLEALRGFFAGPACTAPFDALWTPVLLLVLMTAHWGFAALALVSCLILVAMNLLGEAVSRREMLAANEGNAASLRRAADAVRGAEAVLANGMLPALARRWTSEAAAAAALVHRALVRARMVSAATSALRMAMTGAMVALGLVLTINGQTSGGGMVAANMILARILLPFAQMASTRRRWTDAAASWRRMEVALHETVPARYTAAMPAPVPRLVVERLVYLPQGGDRPLLRGVSFVAEPGESVGVIGPSSAGKSTLLRAVVGQMQPTAGGAFLDGTSTFLWEREDFARHVGFMPQGLSLLDATVAENIARMQRPDLRAVIDAARLAGAHRMIAGLPDGYATRVAGPVLSSGQRQRVALARALYGRPGLLVLDEPSAFLDAAGEAHLVALLARLRAEGVTVLLASHRPALLAGVDRLLVLEGGAVTQFGPRAEVMRALATPSVRLVRKAVS
ncbi:MAG: type I secretion system permease/ATPase [Janthinobacterium lividum]